jgi:Uma2 family endonuclease
MVQTPYKTLTLEEFLAMPETEPASEYIEGQILQKPMPQAKHSLLQLELANAINALTRPQKIALALPELRCTFGGRSIVPDVAIFTWNRIPVDENGDIANTVEGAPDWIIEILSPNQGSMKVTHKILHCLNYGAQMGWMIGPDERFVLVYPAGCQPQSFEALEDVLPVPTFAQGVQLTVGELFGWLKVNQ